MAKKKQTRFSTHVTTPAGDRVYVTGRTKDELAKRVLEKKMELRAGVDIGTDMTFGAYAELWLKTYKSRIRDSSKAVLRYVFDNFLIPYFGQLNLKDIRPVHVQGFLGTITGYSQSLQRKCLSNLRAVLASAVDDGLIVRSPVRKEDKIIAAGPEEEEPLTNDQAKALLSSLEGTRAYTFCLLALSTGMRRGEILGLMWEDIDFDEKVIRVRHNKALPSDGDDGPVTELLKTEAGRRNLPMSDMLAEHLRALRAASDSEFVLSMRDGRSLTKSSFRSLWGTVETRTEGKGRTRRELGAHYGHVHVCLDFDCHPHQLRHTYITQLFEAGLDLKQVQYLAGHSTPEMTMRVYTHYREKQRKGETHEQVCAALSYLSQ